jgi:hypothetical protein
VRPTSDWNVEWHTYRILSHVREHDAGTLRECSIRRTVKTFLIAANVRNTSQLPCDSFISKELSAIQGSYRVVGLLYTTLAWIHSKPPGADPIYPKFERQLSLTQRYDQAEISLYLRQHMSYRCYFFHYCSVRCARLRSHSCLCARRDDTLHIAIRSHPLPLTHLNPRRLSPYTKSVVITVRKACNRQQLLWVRMSKKVSRS